LSKSAIQLTNPIQLIDSKLSYIEFKKKKL